MDPGAGEGVTPSIAIETTVPSASAAVTLAVAAVPWMADRVPPQLATTGWLAGQGLGAVAVLRGPGAPAEKSAALSSVSVQPPARRETAAVLLPAGALEASSTSRYWPGASETSGSSVSCPELAPRFPVPVALVYCSDQPATEALVAPRLNSSTKSLAKGAPVLPPPP